MHINAVHVYSLYEETQWTNKAESAKTDPITGLHPDKLNNALQDQQSYILCQSKLYVKSNWFSYMFWEFKSIVECIQTFSENASRAMSKMKKSSNEL